MAFNLSFSSFNTRSNIESLLTTDNEATDAPHAIRWTWEGEDVVEEREERFPELGVWGANRTREVGGSCGMVGFGCFGGEVRGLDCDLYPLLRVELSVVSTAEEEVIMVDSNGVVAALAAAVVLDQLYVWSRRGSRIKIQLVGTTDNAHNTIVRWSWPSLLSLELFPS
eukprot:scaffold11794_cov133-Skeletonema_marinoi.AAC.6